MEYRQLGGSGLKVSALSFGTATFGGGNAFFSAWGKTDVTEGSLVQQIGSEGLHIPYEKVYEIVNAIDAIAEETGKSVSQIALNWLLQRPTVASVIVGARNEEQLKHNLGAVGWSLTAEQVEKLDKASEIPTIYPYWHQRPFAERNPLAVPFYQD